jgi:hypothetical protein
MEPEPLDGLPAIKPWAVTIRQAELSGLKRGDTVYIAALYLGTDNEDNPIIQLYGEDEVTPTYGEAIHTDYDTTNYSGNDYSSSMPARSYS